MDPEPVSLRRDCCLVVGKEVTAQLAGRVNTHKKEGATTVFKEHWVLALGYRSDERRAGVGDEENVS